MAEIKRRLDPGSPPTPREERVEAGGGVAGDAGEHVGEPACEFQPAS